MLLIRCASCWAPLGDCEPQQYLSTTCPSCGTVFHAQEQLMVVSPTVCATCNKYLPCRCGSRDGYDKPLQAALGATKEKRMVTCPMCSEEREGLYHLTKRGLAPHDDGICEQCWYSFNNQVKVPGAFSDTFSEPEQKFILDTLNGVRNKLTSAGSRKILEGVIEKLKTIFTGE